MSYREIEQHGLIRLEIALERPIVLQSEILLESSSRESCLVGHNTVSLAGRMKQRKTHGQETRPGPEMAIYTTHRIDIDYKSRRIHSPG